MEGDPKFKASQGIPYVPYHARADLIGLKGIKVNRSADIADAWREAFAAGRPAIIDAMTDPGGAADPAARDLCRDEGDDQLGPRRAA